MIAFIILVFLEAPDTSTPLAQALAEAAEHALGPRVSVSVRASDRETPDQALLARGRDDGAQAVARIAWEGADHLAARVEVTVVATGRVAAQSLTFDGSDPLVERGRALGLVIASLLRAETTQRAEPSHVEARPAASTTVIPAPPPVARRWALDAVVQGGFAIGGAGSGLGGAVGLRWLPFRRFGFRLGGRARFGEVGAAQAASAAYAASAGIVTSLLGPREERRFGLDVRLDALVMYESLSHLSPDDPEPVRRGRLVPGATLLAEARLSLSPMVALVLAAGPEVAFGMTQVFVRQAVVTELAPWRAVVQAGLVAAF